MLLTHNLLLLMLPLPYFDSDVNQEIIINHCNKPDQGKAQVPEGPLAPPTNEASEISVNNAP